ncbi:hypothetical protein N7540_004257 [Penicillium herquei]|nr:hypothetical protein N7540_004257 [Penicillium herquei]
MDHLNDLEDSHSKPIKLDELIEPSHIERHIFNILKQIAQPDPTLCSRIRNDVISKEAWEFVKAVEKMIFWIVQQIPPRHNAMYQMAHLFKEFALTWWGGLWMNLDQDRLFILPPLSEYEDSEENWSDNYYPKWETMNLSTHSFLATLLVMNIVVSVDLAAEVFHAALEARTQHPNSMHHLVTAMGEWLFVAGFFIYEDTKTDRRDWLPGPRRFESSLGGLTRWNFLKYKLYNMKMNPSVSKRTKMAIEFHCLERMKEIESHIG